MAKIQFTTNVPVEVRLRSIEGTPTDSKFGGVQHMFTAEEGAFWVSETVGEILTDQLRKLRVRIGEPVEICKREVSRGNGRKGIQWEVARVEAFGEQQDGTLAVPMPPATPKAQQASNLEAQLAASIDQAQARKAPARVVAEGWQTVLLAQTNALTDVYAAALAHASEQHGNSVKPEDIRALMTTAFINLSKSASNGGRNAA